MFRCLFSWSWTGEGLFGYKILCGSANNEEKFILLKEGYNQMNDLLKVSSSQFPVQCKNWLELSTSRASALNPCDSSSLSSHLDEEKDSDRVVLLPSSRVL